MDPVTWQNQPVRLARGFKSRNPGPTALPAVRMWLCVRVSTRGGPVGGGSLHERVCMTSSQTLPGNGPNDDGYRFDSRPRDRKKWKDAWLAGRRVSVIYPLVGQSQRPRPTLAPGHALLSGPAGLDPRSVQPGSLACECSDSCRRARKRPDPPKVGAGSSTLPGGTRRFCPRSLMVRRPPFRGNCGFDSSPWTPIYWPVCAG